MFRKIGVHILSGYVRCFLALGSVFCWLYRFHSFDFWFCWHTRFLVLLGRIDFLVLLACSIFGFVGAASFVVLLAYSILVLLGQLVFLVLLARSVFGFVGASFFGFVGILNFCFCSNDLTCLVLWHDFYFLVLL